MPLFNEAKTIERTLEELDSNLTKHFYEHIFFIQNDASTDSSLQVIQSLSLFTQGKIQVESNLVNVGHGPSVMRAYHRALETNHELVLHVDSDGDVDFESVVRCVDIVRDSKNDVVIGSRVGRDDPLYRQIVSRLLRYSLFAFFGIASRDVNSPIRVYRRNILEQFLHVCPVEAVTPHVLLTIIAHKSDSMLSYQPVMMKTSPLQPVLGSTWRSSRRLLGLPTRFVRLVTKATLELITFRVTLRRRLR